MKKANSLLAMLTPKDVARMWSKVDKRGSDECWPWLGAVTRAGYGTFDAGPRSARKRSGAHRVVWEVVKGEQLPTDLAIDHLCKNTVCVNPDHLEPVPQRVNVLRGDSVVGKVNREMVCLRGHDLTLPDAFVVSPTARHCRKCQQVRRRARYERDRTGLPRFKSAQEVGCSVDGCTRPHYAKTLCKRHYGMAQRASRSA